MRTKRYVVGLIAACVMACDAFAALPGMNLGRAVGKGEMPVKVETEETGQKAESPVTVEPERPGQEVKEEAKAEAKEETKAEAKEEAKEKQVDLKTEFKDRAEALQKQQKELLNSLRKASTEERDRIREKLVILKENWKELNREFRDKIDDLKVKVSREAIQGGRGGGRPRD